MTTVHEHNGTSVFGFVPARSSSLVVGRLELVDSNWLRRTNKIAPIQSLEVVTPKAERVAGLSFVGKPR